MNYFLVAGVLIVSFFVHTSKETIEVHTLQDTYYLSGRTVFSINGINETFKTRKEAIAWLGEATAMDADPSTCLDLYWKEVYIQYDDGGCVTDIFMDERLKKNFQFYEYEPWILDELKSYGYNLTSIYD